MAEDLCVRVSREEGSEDVCDEEDGADQVDRFEPLVVVREVKPKLQRGGDDGDDGGNRDSDIEQDAENARV